MSSRPQTETISAGEARRQWSALLSRVGRGETRVLVEQSGRPVAGRVSAADLQRLTQLDEARERDFRVVDEIWAAFADVPDDELEREIDRAISESRQARRARLAES